MNRLKKLASALSNDEAEELKNWIASTLTEYGFEHPELCLMNRPHSHSCDCDCGLDDLQDKILRILDKP